MGALILDIFYRTFVLYLTFVIHFRFGTALGTANMAPFRSDGNLFKPAMLFTGKLVNRHAAFPC
jgi:hypothetical protein